MSVDLFAGSFAIAYCAVTSLFDLHWRRIPNLWLAACLLYLAVIYVFHPFPWSWWGALAGLGITLAARLPRGDAKAVALLGGVVGAPIIAVASVAALVGAGLAFVLYRLGRAPYPGEWALFPFFAVPTCAIVFALTAI